MSREQLLARVVTDPRVLAKDSRRGLLDEPGLPREVFELLAADSTHGFRRYVARSPHTPADIRAELQESIGPVGLCEPMVPPATDRNERARRAADPTASPEELAALADTRCSMTLTALALNPASTELVLEKLLEQPDGQIHRVVARHRREPAIIARIADSGSMAARAYLAANPACPHDLRVRILLADDSEPLLTMADHVAGEIDPRDTALARVAAAWVRGDWTSTVEVVEACFAGGFSANKIGFMLTMDPDRPVAELVAAARGGVKPYALTRFPEELRLSTAAGRRGVLENPAAYAPAIRLRVGATVKGPQVCSAATSQDDFLRLGAASNPNVGSALAGLLADPDDRIRASAAVTMMGALG